MSEPEPQVKLVFQSTKREYLHNRFGHIDFIYSALRGPDSRDVDMHGKIWGAAMIRSYLPHYQYGLQYTLVDLKGRIKITLPETLMKSFMNCGDHYTSHMERALQSLWEIMTIRALEEEREEVKLIRHLTRMWGVVDNALSSQGVDDQLNSYKISFNDAFSKLKDSLTKVYCD